GAAGVNAATAPVPWSRLTVPATGLVPRNSWTEEELSVPLATGSLKTTTIAELSRTSVFLCGGLVRTTTGGRRAATARRDCRTAPPVAFLTITSIESPVAALTGTGSNPPVKTAVMIDPACPTRRMSAVCPAGTAPGGKDTYATGSASAPVRATPDVAVWARPTGCTAFETIKLSGGGGAVHVAHGLSEQPPSHPSTLRIARPIPALTHLVAE